MNVSPAVSSKQRREECLRRFFLLWGIDPPPSMEFVQGAYGKPMLKGKNVPCFSVTHSGSLWSCAVAPFPLGLDAEQERPVDTEGLARRFFHPEEYAFLKKGNFTDFFQVWTAKESFVKYTGRGLGKGMGTFCVTGKEGILSQVEGAFLQPLSFPYGYRACLCTPAPAQVRFYLLWRAFFSDVGRKIKKVDKRRIL